MSKSPILTPSVFLKEERPTTTSHAIADFFGKRHCDVIRDIRNTMKDCPRDFCERNFAETSKTLDMPKGGTRQVGYFELSRDAFVLVTMGYTGTKAMSFKVAYITAFNEMEALLAQRQPSLSPAPTRLTLSTIEERKPLGELVKEWVKVTGMISGKAWSKINEHFGLRRIGDLPREMLPEAMDFVRANIEMANRIILAYGQGEDKTPAQYVAPVVKSDTAGTFELVSPPAPQISRKTSVTAQRHVLALPVGKVQDGVDQTLLEDSLRRAEDLNTSYNMAMRELVEELRTPFGTARQDSQLPERVRNFATSVLYGLSDMQTACTVLHNAVLSSARMAVDGCRVLSETR